MVIKIIGYVTELHGRKGFTIKITEDNVEDEKGKHPNVSKEKWIDLRRYSFLNNSDKLGTGDDSSINEFNELALTIESLKKGDRVECHVYIVDEKNEDNETVFYINKHPIDKKHYTEFTLWLHLGPNMFQRLEVDTRETIKFRKQNYYMDKNRQKCVKITGDEYQKYNKSWWINKNPKLLFITFNWLRIKTMASKLWKVVKDKENLQTTLNVILAITTTISIIVAIFK